MATQFDFSGIWHSAYHYTSSVKQGHFTSEYDVRMHRTGNQLVVQSLPTEKGDYILLRLTVDDRILTGTWYEQTAPTGDYKGFPRYGALQLIVAEDGKSMRGKWVGFNRKMTVQCDDWEITLTDKKE